MEVEGLDVDSSRDFFVSPKDPPPPPVCAVSTSPFVDHRPAPETKLWPFPCDRNARFPVRPVQGRQTLQVPTGWAAAGEGFRRPGRLTSTHFWGASDPTSTLGNPALLLLGRASVEENGRDDLGAGDPAPQPRSHVGLV